MRTRHEYQELCIDAREKFNVATLDDMGNDGWRVVAIHQFLPTATTDEDGVFTSHLMNQAILMREIPEEMFPS